MIARELGSAVKILLDPADRRYLTVGRPRVECEADAFNTGQLSVTLRGFANRTGEGAPLISAVHNKGSL
jgi:hypothetical protein